MTAATYNLTIDQGSDFATLFTVTQTVNGVSGPRDLRGYAARATMRPTLESDTFYDFDCIVLSPGQLGKVKMSLPAARSSLMPSGMYHYDLEIYKGTSDVTRLMQGMVALTREVTR